MKFNKLSVTGIVLLLLSGASSILSQEEAVDFDSDRWIKPNSKVVEHMGRKSLMGNAVLKDVVFENGVIEVDATADGSRCFPGIYFRMKDQANTEMFYFRPHKSDEYDALQYTPIYSGISAWQLYSGTGATAAVKIEKDKWIHIRLEVSGTQARIFFDNMDKPALVIYDLKRGKSSGSIGLSGMTTGQVYFADFKYKPDNNLKFDPAPTIVTPPGMITKWQISQPFTLGDIRRSVYPDKKKLSEVKWQDITSEPSGLVNLSQYVPFIPGQINCIIVRTVINSDKEELMKLIFGYSDDVNIFFNGKPVFSGKSRFLSRDPLFTGIVGLNDAVYLDLKKGKNELLFILTETFGGWGYICQLSSMKDDGIVLADAVKKMWETPPVFQVPESIVYNAKRDFAYVSNFTRFPARPDDFGKDRISRFKLDGTIDKLDWVTGLSAPTGICIYNDKLYVVDRKGLNEIDLNTAKIINTYPLEGARFANDVAFDKVGNGYISDSAGGQIYKFSNGKNEVWLKDPEINGPNGLQVVGDRLIVGSSNNERLISVGLKDKDIKTIMELGRGGIDGIKADSQGNLLVSHVEGKLYLIKKTGEKVEMIDSRMEDIFLADFEYIEEKNLLLIPTFYNGSVLALKIVK